METEEKNMQHDLLMLFRRMIRIDFSAYLNELSREEFYTLDVLFQHSEEGCEGMKVSSIAQALDISSPAVSRMLGGMERKGYIIRKVNPQNRRNTIVEFTKSGEKIYERTKDKINGMLAHVIEKVGMEEMEKMIQLWNRIAQAFIEETKFELNDRKGEQL